MHVHKRSQICFTLSIVVLNALHLLAFERTSRMSRSTGSNDAMPYSKVPRRYLDEGKSLTSIMYSLRMLIFVEYNNGDVDIASSAAYLANREKAAEKCRFRGGLGLIFSVLGGVLPRGANLFLFWSSFVRSRLRYRKFGVKVA